MLIAAALAWRLVSLQILEPDRYLAHGAAQRISIVDLPAARGAILDRNGVDLALSVPLQTVAANPRLIEDPIRAARALAQIVDTDVETLEERLSNGRAFVYVDRQVSEDVAEAALDLDLTGIFSIQERSRVRPGEDSAIAILGRTDIDDTGVSGLEYVYDDMLSGTPGELIVETGARGSTIPGGEYQIEPAVLGSDVVLSIDRSLQFAADRLLAEGVEAAGGEAGILIAMDPETGEILASAAVVREGGEIRPSPEHRAVPWRDEPGSIMTPLPFSAVGSMSTTAIFGTPSPTRKSSGRSATSSTGPPTSARSSGRSTSARNASTSGCSNSAWVGPPNWTSPERRLASCPSWASGREHRFRPLPSARELP